MHPLNSSPASCTVWQTRHKCDVTGLYTRTAHITMGDFQGLPPSPPTYCVVADLENKAYRSMFANELRDEDVIQDYKNYKKVYGHEPQYERRDGRQMRQAELEPSKGDWQVVADRQVRRSMQCARKCSHLSSQVSCSLPVQLPVKRSPRFSRGEGVNLESHLHVSRQAGGAGCPS